MIKELIVIAKESVGLLADVSYVLAMEKINIEQINVSVVGEKAVIALGVTSQKYEKAKEALKRSKFEVLPSKSLIVKLEDQPGALAEITKKLADARINVLNIFVIGKKGPHVFDSINVDRPREARKLLGKSVVSEME